MLGKSAKKKPKEPDYHRERQHEEEEKETKGKASKAEAEEEYLLGAYCDPTEDCSKASNAKLCYCKDGGTCADPKYAFKPNYCGDCMCGYGNIPNDPYCKAYNGVGYCEQKNYCSPVKCQGDGACDKDTCPILGGVQGKCARDEWAFTGCAECMCGYDQKLMGPRSTYCKVKAQSERGGECVLKKTKDEQCNNNFECQSGSCNKDSNKCTSLSSLRKKADPRYIDDIPDSNKFKDKYCAFEDWADVGCGACMCGYKKDQEYFCEAVGEGEFGEEGGVRGECRMKRKLGDKCHRHWQCHSYSCKAGKCETGGIIA